MFNESGPWKRELYLCAVRLRQAACRAREEHWPPGEESDYFDPLTEAVFEIERDLMVGCFALRRLLDMPTKVTKDIRKRTVAVTTYPLRAGHFAPNHFEALWALEKYDLSRPASATITTKQMCNLFVHSHVFNLAWDLTDLDLEATLKLNQDDPRLEEGPFELGGFYVATDQTSHTHLTRVELKQVTQCFMDMSRDDVTVLRMRTDHRGRLKIAEASNRASPD